jgi:RNA polymerase sigma factor (sigma-70 family)
LHGRSPLLRLQSDERLIALVRRGSHGAFEVLVARYQTRLLAFCRHMLGSREDAEDVLQEVFAAAFNAILADDRAINVRPWLYRIARNRSLNHLRRVQPIGVDSMDVHLSEHGLTTADKVDGREALRELVADVQELPETQRTALLLREIDALSYEQIAEAMETTIPSIKSLLVRARVSLAEAAEGRRLSCDEVRFELGEIAEGLRHRTTAPVRRHLRGCERCTAFRTELRASSKALAMLLPVGPLLIAKKLLLAHLGLSAGAGGAGGATAGGVAAGTATTSGLLSAGVGTIATKAAVGLAAAAAVTAGAVEIERHVPHRAAEQPAAVVVQTPATSAQAAVTRAAAVRPRAKPPLKDRVERKPEEPAAAEPTQAVVPPAADVVEPGHTLVESSTTSLPVELPDPAPVATVAPAPATTTTTADPAPVATTTTPTTDDPPPATTTPAPDPATDTPPVVTTPVDPPIVDPPAEEEPPPVDTPGASR